MYERSLDPAFARMTDHGSAIAGMTELRMAERVGFEPTNRFYPVTRFPVVLLRPTRTSLQMGFCVRVVYQNGRGEVKAEFGRCRGAVKHEGAKQRSIGMAETVCLV